MTTGRELDGLLASWLDSVRSPHPDGLLENVLTATRSTQPRPAWHVQLSGDPMSRPSGVNRMVPMVVAATITVEAIVVGSGLLAESPSVGPPAPSPTDTAAAPQASLPALGLPGARAAPAGEYGWTGSLGASTGMHRVVQNPGSPDEFRQTQLTFAVADDCFAYGTDVVPRPVTVAGLEGTYVEPYEDPAVMFMPPPRGLAGTGAYAFAVGDRTLCVYLTWDPDTTEAELEAAHQVVESLRAQPIGRDGVRINFSLPYGWDTG